MKKLVTTLISLIMTFCLVAPLYAQQSVADTDGLGRKLDGRELKSFILTTTHPGYYIPSTTNGVFSSNDTTIVAGKHAIVGWQILLSDFTNYEAIATIYDDDNTGVTRTLLINEAEVTATETRPIWFPHARGLTHGLVIKVGGGVQIAIYYVDIR